MLAELQRADLSEARSKEKRSHTPGYATCKHLIDLVTAEREEQEQLEKIRAAGQTLSSSGRSSPDSDTAKKKRKNIVTGQSIHIPFGISEETLFVVERVRKDRKANEPNGSETTAWLTARCASSSDERHECSLCYPGL